MANTIQQTVHRVVATGAGAVTPLGVGCEATWNGLRAGKSGVRKITTFDASDMPVQIAGEISDWTPDAHMARPCARDKTVQLAAVAALEALRQAGLVDANETASADFPIGAIIGSATGPWREVVTGVMASEADWRRVRPTTVPKTMMNAVASSLSIHFGLRGANHVIASACSAAGEAIGQAYQMVKLGAERAVLCGGAESPVCRNMFGGWLTLRVLANHDDPAKASRPFDKNRRGLVLADGAAMLVLESLESARQRGANILCELAGYGASSDAFHLTAPQQAGQVLAMRRCLEDARISPERVNYINAHGTGTQANDEVEANSIREVFGARGADLPISSTKSMLGHSLGAGGAIELLACLWAMQDNFVPPTINCDQPDPELGLDYVPNAGRPHRVDVAMSNSFAFGGSNAVLMLKRFVD
jgi:3-oxoacyl-[acyl-carrier-protein] synthase II